MLIATIICKDGTNRVLKYPHGITLRKKKMPNGPSVTETPLSCRTKIGRAHV